MNISSARLLVFHGSRNSRYKIKIDKLGEFVKQQLRLETETINRRQALMAQTATKATVATIYPKQEPLVEVAVLEFGKLSLESKIVSFAQKAIASSYRELLIIPVFLSAGVHVKQDIPREIALAQRQLDGKIKLRLLDYLGNYSGLSDLIEEKFICSAASGRILLAHGSRLDRGNIASEQLAKKVKAKNAYWTIQPNLTSVVQSLAEGNLSSIAIVPYFLFSGRIIEAIAQEVARLQTQFPHTKLLLSRPLGATSELARIIIGSSFK